MAKIFYLFVHEVAVLISDIAMVINSNWLWERGGNLECWADLKLVKGEDQ